MKSRTANISTRGAVPEDVNYEEVMKLLETPDATALNAVRRVCGDCRNGFLLSHGKQLKDLVEKTVVVYQDHPEFWLALADIARGASMPFVSQKQSDFLHYEKDLPYLLSALARPLGLNLPLRPDDNFEQLRLEIAHMLAAWARFGVPADATYAVDGFRLMEEGTPSMRILFQGAVIDDITKCLRYESCSEVIKTILYALRDMCLYPPVAKQMTNSGVLSSLLQIIRFNHLGNDILHLAAEILWNALELDWEGACTALEQCADAFYEFMKVTVTSGYRFKDKVFRNDIMVLLMYLSKRPQNRRQFAETGLLGLLIYAGAPDVYSRQIAAKREAEMKTEKSVIKPISLTWNPEDDEFRVLLWKTVAMCCNDPVCLQVANEYFFVPTLLTFLDLTDMFCTASSTRTAEQHKLLQIAALGALFVLFGDEGQEEACTAFIDSRGPHILLRLLKGSEDVDLRVKTLRILIKAVRNGCALEPAESMNVLVPLCQGDLPIAMRQCCCAVIALLCQGNPEHCAAFRRNGGVEAIVNEVKYEPENTMEPHLFLTLTVVDLVWAAVVGKRKNEQQFLNNGGLFKLLDIFEIAPMALKRHILGVIADLVDSPDGYAAELFVQWNSRISSKCGLRLLLDIWRRDQLNANAVDNDGIIVDFNYPLNPSKREEADALRASRTAVFATGLMRGSPLMSSKGMGKMHSTHTGFRPSDHPREQLRRLVMNRTSCSSFDKTLQATSEEIKLAKAMKDDCRSRIAAVICKLGSEGHDTLPVEELQAMEIINFYSDCQVLEQWMQVQNALTAENLKPVAGDADWIVNAIKEHETKTARIKACQMQFLEHRCSSDYHALNDFYDRTRSGFEKQKKDVKHAKPRCTKITATSALTT